MNYAQEWFHFYASLKPKGKLCLGTSISFFNELDIEWELCSKASISLSLTQNGNYAHRHLFHFLTSLTQNGNYSHKDMFHFLMRLTQNGNYAHEPTPTEHDIWRLVGCPHYIKSSGLAPLRCP